MKYIKNVKQKTPQKIMKWQIRVDQYLHFIWQFVFGYVIVDTYKVYVT